MVWILESVLNFFKETFIILFHFLRSRIEACLLVNTKSSGALKLPLLNALLIIPKRHLMLRDAYVLIPVSS